MNGVPTCGETGRWRDFGIACQPRGLWRRSGHSTQLLRVMLETWGRTAGRWRCPRPCGGGREPQGDKRSRQTTLQVWRAVCAETCKHRFGEGRLETCRKVTRWPPTLPKKKPPTLASEASTQESSSPVLPEREEFRQHVRRLAVSAVQVLIEQVMREE
jgi:hypothetical protein